MRSKLLLLALLLMGVSVGAQTPISVSISDDCSKNGQIISLVSTGGDGSAAVSSTAGRTSCEYVQLWAGGPKWATFNVGATITDYANLTVGADATPFYDYTDQAPYYNTANCGGLYAWNQPNYNARQTTWTISVTTGVADVATTLWGSKWQTPTRQQLDTLQNSSYGKTTWTWCDGSSTQFVPGCTLTGYKVSGVGAYADKCIFLPAAGGFHEDYGTVVASRNGLYWSSMDHSYNFSYNAYYLGFYSSGRSVDYFGRSGGQSVRAVLVEDAPEPEPELEPVVDGSASVLSTSGRTSCEYVQLWEGGPKWAAFNVGATITDYANLTVGADATSYNNYLDQAPYYNTANVGGLYAWQQPNYNGRQTTWSSVTTGVADVATTLWGSNWKTPTYDQLDTLCNYNNTYGKTTWTWCDGSSTQYVEGCTLKGYKVSGIGAYADKSIFLPAAGYFNYGVGTVVNASSNGRYWSSTVYDSSYAWYMYFRSDDRGMNYLSRQGGHSVRAVLVESATTPTKYTITFLNYDSTTLQIAEVEEGIIPAYAGATPTKPEDALYTYEFAGWTPSIVAATEPATYTATFSAIAKNNVITYTANKKITKTISNKFNVAILDHTFADGLGIITFDGDVTTIKEQAFYQCKELTSITLPNTLKTIGSAALSSTSLTSVVLPDSITTIGTSAFDHCTRLTSIFIPNSVTSIGTYAFTLCDSLVSMVVADGNTTFDSRENCNAIIETATNKLIIGCPNSFIPMSVTSIGQRAFWGCSGLNSFTIPNSVIKIEDNAFYWCKSLQSIIIPESVTSIGDDAFSRCSALTSITIPESVTNIGKRAFSSCEQLASIVVESDNTTYDSRENCNAIIETSTNTLIVGCKSTVIPTSVTRIGDYAFDGCDSLTFLTIPNSVTSIGREAFHDCDGLTSIFIPNSVTSIKEGAFMSCNRIDSITIPNSVTSIEEETFSDCYSLTSVTIPNSVTSIGRRAFSRCGFTSFTIPNSIARIEDETFSNCDNLTSVVIPNTIISIGHHAFLFCHSLTSITCNAIIPPTYGYDCFYGVDNIIPIFVPCEAVDAYKNADGWNDFTNIQPIEGTCSTTPRFFINLSLAGNGAEDNTRVVFNESASLDYELGKDAEKMSGSAPVRFYSLDDEVYYSINERPYGNVLLGYTVQTAGTYTISATRQDTTIYLHDLLTNTYSEMPYTFTTEAGTFNGRFELTSCRPIYSETAVLECNSYEWMGTIYTESGAYTHTLVSSYGCDSIITLYLTIQPCLTEDIVINDGGTTEIDCSVITAGNPDITVEAGGVLLAEGDCGSEAPAFGDIVVEVAEEGTSGVVLACDNSLQANQLIVRMAITGLKWYYLCFPQDVPMHNLSVDAGVEFVVRHYNGNERAINGQGGWSGNIGSGVTLKAGKGYILMTSASTQLDIAIANPQFTCEPIAIELPYYPSSIHSKHTSWSLVGNPFPSYYNISSLYLGNGVHTDYHSALYIYDRTVDDYQVLMLGDDEYVLHPFEAFFLQNPAPYAIHLNWEPAGQLTSATAAQQMAAARAQAEIGNRAQAETSARQFVELTLSADGKRSDKTRVVYNEAAAVDYELGIDAEKMSGAAPIRLYSHDADVRYAINERPMGEVALGFAVSEAGTYTISADRWEADVVLYDHLLGQTIYLSQGDYAFQAEAGTTDDRFTLRRAPQVTTGIGETTTTTTTTTKFLRNGHLYIRRSGSMYDVLGGEVK